MYFLLLFFWSSSSSPIESKNNNQKKKRCGCVWMRQVAQKSIKQLFFFLSCKIHWSSERKLHLSETPINWKAKDINWIDAQYCLILSLILRNNIIANKKRNERQSEPWRFNYSTCLGVKYPIAIRFTGFFILFVQFRFLFILTLRDEEYLRREENEIRCSILFSREMTLILVKLN